MTPDDTARVKVQSRATVMPSRSVDDEAAALLDELSNLQSWCVMMMRKDSGGIPAADLIQRTRILIIERCKKTPRLTDPDFVRVPKVATEAMLEASWQATRVVTPEQRMQAALMTPVASHKHKARDRYAAMIAAAGEG